MTSEPDMSLQVEHTSTTLLSSIDKVVGGPLVNNHSLSERVGQEESTMVQHHQSSTRREGRRGEEQTTVERSIVSAGKPGQNFLSERNTLPNSMGVSHASPSQHNFAEHRNADTTTIHELIGTPHGTHQTSLPFTNTLTVNHNIPISLPPILSSTTIPFHSATGEGGSNSFISNDTINWGTGNFSTITSVNSHPGNLPKPAEGGNQDPTHLGFPFSDNFNARRRQLDSQHYQNQQQHLSLAALSQQIQPPTQSHTATAAEIALGISTSSYNHNQAMGDGTRNFILSRNATDHHIVESKQDSRSIDSSSLRGKDGEEETSRTEDTLAVSSPGRMTPLHDSSDHAGGLEHQRLGMVVGTPSTVSTAPSSDDASLGTDYKLDESMLPNLLHLGHQRSNSWGEDGLLPSSGFSTPPRHPTGETISQNPWMQASPALPGRPQQQLHQPSWGGMQLRIPLQHPPQQQRIASFRNDGPWNKQMAPQQQQQQQPPMHGQYPPQHFSNFPQHQGQQQQPPPPPPPPRKQSYANQTSPHHGTHNTAIPSPSGTPPRASRQQRTQGTRQPSTGGAGSGSHQPSSSSQRSASEVLKTLLRKKACLYEPDTSRSVALVTWLVGRELALEHGFFSRQQLQSGVHACVASKIESGTITRTKVNRCMQIILNSCFHYIIPRSDGTEENGDYFRAVFAATVNDDSSLLRYLPEPWNDLVVERETVLEASLHDEEEKHSQSSNANKSPSETPKNSPKLGSVNAQKSPDRDSHDSDKDDSKRAVLLCFNENVRSAEDVFRCHNEFIRDTANAAHLQLTAQEWRQFFGREVARAPYLWGNVGIPTLTGESSGGLPRQPDLLGQMSQEEVAKFRSTWCTKRYDHDHDLCGFAHVEVNGGWLRRNPLMYPYKDEMCQFISTAGDKTVSPSHFFLNECPKGVQCEFAHSMEEITYHPRRYKTKVCNSLYSRSGGCHLGDVCPNIHPPDATKPLKKSSDGRSHGGRRNKNNDQSNSNTKASGIGAPTGSPVLYASPAPFSSFDQLLAMPGLQNVYRRHCAVIRAHVRSSGKASCIYSPFGDDWGISGAVAAPKSR